jgi:hypothetical protein
MRVAQVSTSSIDLIYGGISALASGAGHSAWALRSQRRICTQQQGTRLPAATGLHGTSQPAYVPTYTRTASRQFEGLWK